jgi:hypothetical protein
MRELGMRDQMNTKRKPPGNYHPGTMDVLFSDRKGPAAVPITHVNVSHDDDCPKLSGGECHCDPDVSKMEVF